MLTRGFVILLAGGRDGAVPANLWVLWFAGRYAVRAAPVLVERGRDWGEANCQAFVWRFGMLLRQGAGRGDLDFLLLSLVVLVDALFMRGLSVGARCEDVGDEVMLFTFYLTLLSDYNGGNFSLKKAPRYTIRTLRPAAIGLADSCPTAVGKGRSIRVQPRISNFVARLYVSRNSVMGGKRILFVVSPMRCRSTTHTTGTTMRATGTGMTARRVAIGGGQRLGGGGVVDSCSLRVTRGALTSTGTRLTSTRTRLVDTGRGLTCAHIADPSGNMTNSVPFHMKDLIDNSDTAPLAAISSVSRVCICFSLARGRLLGLVHGSNSRRRTLGGFPPIRLALTSNALCNSDKGVRAIDNIVSRGANTMDVHTAFPGGNRLLEAKKANDVLVPCDSPGTLMIPRGTACRVRSGGFICMLRSSGAIGGARVGMLGLSSKRGCVIASKLGTNSGVMLRGMDALGSNTAVGPLAPRRSTRRFGTSLRRGGWMGVWGRGVGV